MAEANFFALRPLHLSDAPLILQGRNSDSVRRFMISDHLITPDEHQRWMKKRLAGKDTPYFVFLHKDIPIGLIGLTHVEGSRGQWGFYLWEEKAPRGAGTAMLAAFMEEMFRCRVRALWAEVLLSNEKSLHLHRKLGFKEIGMVKARVVKDGVPQDAQLFEISADEWRARRAAFTHPLKQVVILPAME